MYLPMWLLLCLAPFTILGVMVFCVWVPVIWDMVYTHFVYHKGRKIVVEGKVREQKRR